MLLYANLVNKFIEKNLENLFFEMINHPKIYKELSLLFLLFYLFISQK